MILHGAVIYAKQETLATLTKIDHCAYPHPRTPLNFCLCGRVASR
jgi:hypothetical protein